MNKSLLVEKQAKIKHLKNIKPNSLYVVQEALT